METIAAELRRDFGKCSDGKTPSVLSKLNNKKRGLLKEVGIFHDPKNRGAFHLSPELRDVFESLISGSNTQEEFRRILTDRPTDKNEMKALVASIESKLQLMNQDEAAELDYKEKFEKLVMASGKREVSDAKAEAELAALRAAERAEAEEKLAARNAAKREEERKLRLEKAAAAVERRMIKEAAALAEAKAAEEARKAKRLAKQQQARGRVGTWAARKSI